MLELKNVSRETLKESIMHVLDNKIYARSLQGCIHFMFIMSIITLILFSILPIIGILPIQDVSRETLIEILFISIDYITLELS